MAEASSPFDPKQHHIAICSEYTCVFPVLVPGAANPARSSGNSAAPLPGLLDFSSSCPQTAILFDELQSHYKHMTQGLAVPARAAGGCPTPRSEP